jgi:drug/metabolite transporter (DMT)-like permease
LTQPRQLALFLIIGLIWGSEWIARQAIDAPPLLALALRYGLAALLLGVVVVARRVQTPRRRDVIESSVLGLTFLAIPAVLTLWAGQRLSPGLLLVILSMVPLLAVLLENRAAGVPLPLIGGVGGTALLLAPSLSFELTQLPGALAVLAAAVSIAGSIFYIKTRLSTADPMVLAASQFAASALALVAASLILEGKPVWGWTSRSLASEVVLALVANALAFPIFPPASTMGGPSGDFLAVARHPRQCRGRLSAAQAGAILANSGRGCPGCGELVETARKPFPG